MTGSALSVNCGIPRALDRTGDQINSAIEQLQKGNATFADIDQTLNRLKQNLDNGIYKDQVDDLIGRTGQVAQLSGQASADFVRNRVIEDLQRLKAHVEGKPAPPRVPVLTNTQSPKIDYTSSARSTLTVVGWNLDVAQGDSQKYSLVIKNQDGDRPVDRRYVTFQGQYAITLDISPSGVPLRYNDTKLVYQGFAPPFEIAIINSNPPPAPEYFTDLRLESVQEQDDKDSDIKVRVRLTFDGNPYVDFTVGKGETWKNPGSVVMRILPANAGNRLCMMDAMKKYALSFVSHMNEVDQDCTYLLVQPNIVRFIRGSGKKATLSIEALEDNSGWNGHFTLMGKTSAGNTVSLITTLNTWFGGNHSEIYQTDFTW